MYKVYVNSCDFGIYEAALTAQEARDMAAQDAGYLDEADMERQLGQTSEIAVVELDGCRDGW